MSKKYLYGHRTTKKHRLMMLFLLVPVCLVLAVGAYVVRRDLNYNQSSHVEGTARVVAQVAGDASQKMTMDEPLYTVQLPKDWKVVERIANQNEQSVKWQATKKNQDNRTLKIYVDIIPTDYPVNRLLPVSSTGSTITTGDVSDNCATFTVSKEKLGTAPSRSAGVDFICNIAGFVDNQVGTSSIGGVNQVTVTGAKGPHKYFFLFVDHNIQPDYSILQDAVQSFRAK